MSRPIGSLASTRTVPRAMEIIIAPGQRRPQAAPAQRGAAAHSGTLHRGRRDSGVLVDFARKVVKEKMIGFPQHESEEEMKRERVDWDRPSHTCCKHRQSCRRQKRNHHREPSQRAEYQTAHPMRPGQVRTEGGKPRAPQTHTNDEMESPTKQGLVLCAR